MEGRITRAEWKVVDEFDEQCIGELASEAN